jgi:hypothetical protein
LTSPVRNGAANVGNESSDLSIAAFAATIY